MLALIGSMALGFIEKELVKLEPEIQQELLQEISKLSNLLIEFVNSKLEKKIGN